ncbi:MAG: hypothetical protein ACTSR8_21235 [Promethearchaeota archaeon]
MYKKLNKNRKHHHSTLGVIFLNALIICSLVFMILLLTGEM